MSECISSSMYALPRTNLDTFRTRSFPLCDDSLRTPEQGQYPLLWHLPIHSVELSWATTRSCRSALIIINVVVRLRTVLYRVIPTGCYARLIVGISPETKKTKDNNFEIQKLKTEDVFFLIQTQLENFTTSLYMFSFYHQTILLPQES